MRRKFLLATTLVGAVALVGLAAAQSADPSPDPQNAPQITAEQQKQLDNLKGLEQQLQKDREAVHNALSQFGRDSDKTDAALQQLFNTRLQYRQLRRSVRQAGVPVPSAAGAGPGWRAGAARQTWRRGEGYGRGSAGCRCRCPCGGC